MKEEIIKQFNADDGYINIHNFKVIELNEKEAVIEYKVDKDGLNSLGIVHGGLLFGLADTTAGILACMTGTFPLTTSSNINYLNMAKCEKLIAKAQIIKVGDTLGYYKVDVFDETDKIICTCNVNMYFKK